MSILKVDFSLFICSEGLLCVALCGNVEDGILIRRPDGVGYKLQWIQSAN